MSADDFRGTSMMEYKLVCDWCGQDHGDSRGGYADMVRLLADEVDKAVARGVPERLLPLLSLVPADYVWNRGAWVHPDDLSQGGT